MNGQTQYQIVIGQFIAVAEWFHTLCGLQSKHNQGLLNIVPGKVKSGRGEEMWYEGNSLGLQAQRSYLVIYRDVRLRAFTEGTCFGEVG